MQPEPSGENQRQQPELPGSAGAKPVNPALAKFSDFAGRLSEILFGLLVVLMLTTPSWRAGTFTWLPLAHFSDLGGVPVSAGFFILLPFALAAAWATHLLVRWRLGRSSPWVWGRRGITVPLIVLTLLGITTLDLTLGRIVFIQLGGLVVFWGIYFFLLNQRPNVVMPLAIVIMVQTGVALVQFITQSDSGLVALGELPLDPRQSGVIVLFARGQKWLRGYGLTAHPNLLGAMMTALLLLLIPAIRRAAGRQRLLLAIVFATGLLGLFASFSRSATLAFVIALAAWLILEGRVTRRSGIDLRFKKMIRSPWLWLSVVALPAMLFFFGDLALSRIFALDSTVEAVSINQRLADWRLSLTLIGRHPLRGVGLGQYIVAAKTINPFAVTVHNVPLLVTAELGFPGLLVFLWLVVAGLRSRPAALAPWIAVIVIGIFDVTLWLSGNWQTAIVVGLIAANLSHDITNSTSA